MLRRGGREVKESAVGLTSAAKGAMNKGDWSQRWSAAPPKIQSGEAAGSRVGGAATFSERGLVLVVGFRGPECPRHTISGLYRLLWGLRCAWL